MSAQIIDGKIISGELKAEVARQVAALKAAHGFTPGLAVVLVGEDPASQVYVRNKHAATVAAGINSFEHRLPADTAQADLMALIARLNADPSVDGILVQLPLPKGLDAQAVIEAIDPAKDVDGFHPVNVGKLSSGLTALTPCTPLGSMIMLRTVHENLTGMEAVVVGRSNIVGKPMAQLLLGANCTVTIAHSRTHDLPAVCRRADILVAAVGQPQMIKGDWVKPGATVIDVGINRITGEAGKTRLVGDVDFASAAEVAGAITPVPGGVGLMTVACLLANTVSAACALRGLPAPRF